MLVIWLGFGLGSLTSIMFNIKYSLDANDPMALFAAFAWPVFAVLAVEILIRANWGEGIWWTLVRFVGVGTVALGAMRLSLTHTCSVLRSWGYGQFDAVTGAIVIDGLMLLSGAALLAAHTQPKRTNRTAGTATARARKRPATRKPRVPATPVPQLQAAA